MKQESDITKLIKLLFTQQELIEYLLESRIILPCGADKSSFDLKNNIKKLEKHFINEALKETHGNKVHAAKLLKITRATIFFKIKKYNIKGTYENTNIKNN